MLAGCTAWAEKKKMPPFKKATVKSVVCDEFVSVIFGELFYYCMFLCPRVEH